MLQAALSERFLQALLQDERTPDVVRAVKGGQGAGPLWSRIDDSRQRTARSGRKYARGCPVLSQHVARCTRLRL
jgi:hypothetical protein